MEWSKAPAVNMPIITIRSDGSVHPSDPGEFKAALAKLSESKRDEVMLTICRIKIRRERRRKH